MAENDLQVVIEITSGTSSGQTVTVPPGHSLLVGRLDECDITIQDDPVVSRRHCQVQWLPPILGLTNLSANGTRLNGADIESSEIHDGDEIQIGNATVLAIRLHADDPAEGPAQSEHPPADVVEEAPAAAAGGELTPDSRQPDRPPVSSDHSGEATPAPGSLQVVHGPAAGMTAPLAAGKPLVIGSQADCDLVIEQDRSVSREHCRIELVPPDCQLHDLSSHGTMVNHRRVDEIVGLSDGDEIEIGHNSVIRVSLADSGSTPDAEGSASPVCQVTCQTGLVLTTSAPDNTAGLWAMAQRLSSLSPLHAIVDFARGGSALPEDFTDPNYLLDWLSAEIIAEHSPVLLSPEDRDRLPAAVQEVTGNDAAMLIFSQSPTPDLHQHLRSLATFNPATGKKSRTESLFAYWWPSLLHQILQNSQQDVVEEIMTGIDGVLIEAPDEGGWCIFATEEFSQKFERFELVSVLQESPPSDNTAD
jgi:pSer/pThr/pTyr-binding forkhead associated (FHA) protein